VTSDSALDWDPVWSPDGKHLYFGSDRDGTLNLWRVAMNETAGKPIGAPEPLTLPADISGTFAFSQQGQLVYGTMARSYRVMAFAFDGKSGRADQGRELFGRSQEITFEPSPDQRSIAFTAGSPQEDLFIANADGTRLRQMTNDPAKDRGVTWSRDGRTLYLYSNRDGAYHIWSMQKDGSALTRLTDDADLRRNGVRGVYVPDVSPDGRTLATLTDRSTALVHLDRPLTQRLEPLGFVLGVPKWSPDGRQLVGTNGARGIALYSFQTRRLEPVRNSGVGPQWLPDGRHIVFFEKGSIGLLDLDSRRVTTTPFTLPGVDWDDPVAAPYLSRDGSTLYVGQTLEQGNVWMTRFGG
jgi:Tol biopolymer transport system component